MKRLKTLRLVLAAVFMAASSAYACLAVRPVWLADLSVRLQIIPSALGVTLGATLVWLTLTLLAGRVYCATACPVGTLLDCGVWLRRRIPPLARRPFRFRPARRGRWEILGAYAVCVILGVGVVPALIEPWHIFANLAAPLHLSESASVWMHLGINGLTGIIAGLVTALLVLASSLVWGRAFCTGVCPVGTALGAVTHWSLHRIEIDPDRCINCMECERNCPASCIKVVSRYVDDTRCIRCMDCTARCPNGAIRLQAHRNRPATPLFIRRVTSQH